VEMTLTGGHSARRRCGTGRLAGVAWCCTVDEHGDEHDVGFGLTTRTARRRCLRRQAVDSDVEIYSLRRTGGNRSASASGAACSP
jgi:hypothetical protein